MAKFWDLKAFKFLLTLIQNLSNSSITQVYKWVLMDLCPLWTSDSSHRLSQNLSHFGLLICKLSLVHFRWRWTFKTLDNLSCCRIQPSQKLELIVQVRSWQMELEARQSQQGVINCTICFWMQFVRAWISWPSGHTAWAICSPWHFLGNTKRITNRFLRGIPQFGRYLGSQVTGKVYLLKNRNNLKITEDMHNLAQMDPKSLWKTCMTIYSFFENCI